MLLTQEIVCCQKPAVCAFEYAVNEYEVVDFDWSNLWTCDAEQWQGQEYKASDS